MEWMLIISMLAELLLPLLDDCLEPSEKGVKTLRRFGLFTQLTIARGARQAAKAEGRSTRGVGRDAVREARETIDNATDDELIEMLEEIRATVTDTVSSGR